MTHTDTANTAPTKKQPSNFTQRLVTSLVLAPFVLVLVLLGGVPFTLAVAFAAVVASLEFYVLAENRPEQGSALVGTPVVLILTLLYHVGQPQYWPALLGLGAVLTLVIEFFRHPGQPRRNLRQLLMTLFGVLYIGFPAAFLVALRGFQDGLMWLLVVLALTWGTDIMAYLGGRLWGRTRLAPRISPKKTVEGAVVGYVGGVLTGLLILAVAGRLSAASLVLVLLGPIIAIAGDLFESALKRAFQAKDSHLAGFDILPGHGGVLDRIDALIWVTVLCYFYILVFQLSAPL